MKPEAPATATAAARRAPPRWLTIALLLGGGLGLGTWCLLWCTDISWRWQVPNEQVVADTGFVFRIEMPPDCSCCTTDGQRGDHSELRLFEDERELGPAHAAHDTIRTLGGGNFSHWGDTLWFSTRDGSDPRRNGHHYRVQAPRRPATWLLWAGAALLLCAGTQFVRARPAMVPAGAATTARVIGCGLLLLTGVSLLALLGLHFAPRHIDQPVAATKLRSSTRPGLPTLAEARSCFELDLFGSQIPWRTPPFFVGDWPPAAGDSARLQVTIDGVEASAVGSLEQLGTVAPPCFTVLGGVSLALCLQGSSPAPAMTIALTVLPNDGVWLITLLVAATGLVLLARAARIADAPPFLAPLELLASALLPTSLALLAANVTGLWLQPLRAPLDATTLGRTLPTADRTLSWTEVAPQLTRQPGEAAADCVVRLSNLVADSVAHVWDRRLASELRLQVPLTENWLLWLHGEVDARGREYFFVDARRLIERGIGMCGHVAHALNQLLSEADIDARVVQLGGHTVVTAKVDDNHWWIADPDFRVVLHASLPELERNPALVQSTYREAIARVDPDHAAARSQLVAELFGKDANSIAPTYLDPAITDDMREREQFAYRWKWPLPLLGLLPWLATRLRRRAVGRRSGST